MIEPGGEFVITVLFAHDCGACNAVVYLDITTEQ